MSGPYLNRSPPQVLTPLRSYPTFEKTDVQNESPAIKSQNLLLRHENFYKSGPAAKNTRTSSQIHKKKPESSGCTNANPTPLVPPTSLKKKEWICQDAPPRALHESKENRRTQDESIMFLMQESCLCIGASTRIRPMRERETRSSIAKRCIASGRALDG